MTEITKNDSKNTMINDLLKRLFLIMITALLAIIVWEYQGQNHRLTNLEVDTKAMVHVVSAITMNQAAITSNLQRIVTLETGFMTMSGDMAGLKASFDGYCKTVDALNADIRSFILKLGARAP